MKIAMDAEKNRIEEAAEAWWEKNGFQFKFKARYLTKSVYSVSKNGKSSVYEIPFCITDMKGFMEGFKTYWRLVESIS